MLARLQSVLFLVFLCAAIAPVQAEDSNPLKVCARCHGEDGNSNKSPTPSISGLTSDYIVAALKEYQDGTRQCGFSKVKCKLSAKWDDELIALGAAHYSSSQRVRAEQAFDAALAEQGRTVHEAHCGECHSGSATSTGEGGLLKGQWREYIEYAMQQYKSGSRKQPEDMAAATKALSDSDWEALLNYYASDL